VNKRKIRTALKGLRSLEQKAPVQVRRTRDWFKTLRLKIDDLEAGMGKDIKEPIVEDPPVAVEPTAPVEAVEEAPAAEATEEAAQPE